MPTYHIVLDLEMNPVSEFCYCTCNGLKTETIEIGVIKINARTNQIVDEFSCVVRPQFNHRIEPQITRLTGISTSEVKSTNTFVAALSNFVDWIGHDTAQIYSWSPSDYSQLKKECFAKHIEFPDALLDWIDFQAEYPKYLGYSHNRCFSLKDAANLIGSTIIPSRAHRALYDAQVTAKLVLFALTEEYKHYASRISDIMDRTNSTMTYSIGDACGSKLAALLARMNANEEREVSQYGREFVGTTPAFVR